MARLAQPRPFKTCEKWVDKQKRLAREKDADQKKRIAREERLMEKLQIDEFCRASYYRYARRPTATGSMTDRPQVSRSAAAGGGASASPRKAPFVLVPFMRPPANVGGSVGDELSGHTAPAGGGHAADSSAAPAAADSAITESSLQIYDDEEEWENELVDDERDRECFCCAGESQSAHICVLTHVAAAVV